MDMTSIPRTVLALSLCLAALAAESGSAFAQGVTAPAGFRSERTAYRLSLWSTIVPVVAGIALMPGAEEDGGMDSQAAAWMLTAGMFAGPAVGHLYAGEPRRALRGIGMRLGASMVTGLALAAIAFGETDGDEFDGKAAALGAAAGVGIIYLVATDIGAARTSARLHNERLQPVRVAILPRADLRGGMGVSLAARF